MGFEAIDASRDRRVVLCDLHTVEVSDEPHADLEPELNAITLLTDDMRSAVAFYRVLDFPIEFGGPDQRFTTLRVGRNYINLSVESTGPAGHWGRFIIHVPSPDAVWRRFVDAGYEPSFEPRDAPWGERYFHILDPDGHEVSFACPLDRLPAASDEPGSPSKSTG